MLPSKYQPLNKIQYPNKQKKMRLISIKQNSILLRSAMLNRLVEFQLNLFLFK